MVEATNWTGEPRASSVCYQHQRKHTLGVWVARRPPGYAFIDFDDRRDAEDAIREIDEETIVITFFLQWFYQQNNGGGLAKCHLQSFWLSSFDMWNKIVKAPNMDGLARKPDLLSFHIASKMQCLNLQGKSFWRLMGCPIV
ncbi:hypothetical protein POM88_012025 [Heracleum sosnowskyi]|uniref:RRM domain-containing protein n=1 Tax=Heracleum sosnowskyi TaxID=360622 RepID=A0AAD8IXE0_9APIA|nr:hypothetical protein POM88_012025 [Heracleum sosnowskyi]